jgi:cytoskeleton protein RodZ
VLDGAPLTPSRLVSAGVSTPGPSSVGALAAPRLRSGLLAPHDSSAALALSTPAAPSPKPPSPAGPGPSARGPGLVASPAAAALPAPALPVAAATGDAIREKPSAGLDAAGAPAGEANAGRIEIRALADCWIQVRSADQSIVFSRVLKAGETYHVPRAGLALRTGNAGALAIAIDGKPAPTIGSIGTLRRDVELDPEALLAGTAVRG